MIHRRGYRFHLVSCVKKLGTKTPWLEGGNSDEATASLHRPPHRLRIHRADLGERNSGAGEASRTGITLWRESALSLVRHLPVARRAREAVARGDDPGREVGVHERGRRGGPRTPKWTGGSSRRGVTKWWEAPRATFGCGGPSAKEEQRAVRPPDSNPESDSTSRPDGRITRFSPCCETLLAPAGFSF